MKLPGWSSLIAIMIAASSIVFAVVVERTVGGEDPLTFGSVPDFELVRSTGETVTRADFDGRVWVANFIFTNCGGTCPMMTYQMGKLDVALPEDVHLVSITVDPTRDSPEVLAAYAESRGATSDRWYFLTGEREEIYDLAKAGFHLAVDDTIGTTVEPITHSSRFALVDRTGEIRTYYDGTSLKSIDRVITDAGTLLAQ